MRSEPFAAGALALLFWTSLPVNGFAAEPKPAPPDPTTVARGKPNYERYCASCHGELGDGRGSSAPFLDPRPRDFTQGAYKWRSTASGTLPLDQDLFRTIRGGLYNTNMPRWSALTDDQIWELIAYVEHFSPLFYSDPRGAVLVIPPPPIDTAAAVVRGKQVYGTMGCAGCHGGGGRGDGSSAKWPGLSDDWGDHIQPANLTTGRLKCGKDPRDIYWVFMTGLNGTPMPSFSDSLTPAQAWDLAFYIKSLSDQ